MIIKENKRINKLFEDIKKIEADCMDFNSYNVLISNGFAEENINSSKMWNMKYIL